jgi:hypothetical protein
MMHKVRLSVALAMLLTGVILVNIASARAEFLSLTKSSEGEATAMQRLIGAGGLVITCLSTSKPATWTIQNGSEHTEKGPDLVTLIKLWGQCVAEASGIPKLSAKGNECKEELRQPKEELSVLLTFATTCALTMETSKKTTCEVKLEAGSNKELKEVALYNSGEGDKNLNFAYKVSGVTTTVNKACEEAGVNSTKVGTITGSAEEKQIQPGGTPAIFTVAFEPNNVFTTQNEKRKAVVSNTGTTPGTPTIAFTAPAANLTWWQALNLTNCQKVYLGNQACTFEIELLHTRAVDEPAGVCYVTVTSPGGQVSRITYYY